MRGYLGMPVPGNARSTALREISEARYKYANVM